MTRELIGDLVCRTVHRVFGCWAEDFVMTTPTYGRWPVGTMRCCCCLRLWLPGYSSSQITEEGVRS